MKGISTNTDSLGVSSTLLVDLSVHSLTAVMKTAYWFTDRYFLYLHRPEGNPEQICIEIRNKDINTQTDNLNSVCAEFSNALIDQTVRQMVLTETSAVRDALVKKAFGEGSNHLDPESLQLGSLSVPMDATYESDPMNLRRTSI